MEARVHFLTEDKIKLGDDIRQYVEQIAVDFEKKEKLSIEADIWRSKFLASRCYYHNHHSEVFIKLIHFSVLLWKI